MQPVARLLTLSRGLGRIYLSRLLNGRRSIQPLAVPAHPSRLRLGARVRVVDESRYTDQALAAESEFSLQQDDSEEWTDDARENVVSSGFLEDYKDFCCAVLHNGGSTATLDVDIALLLCLTPNLTHLQLRVPTHKENMLLAVQVIADAFTSGSSHLHQLQTLCVESNWRQDCMHPLPSVVRLPALRKLNTVEVEIPNVVLIVWDVHGLVKTDEIAEVPEQCVFWSPHVRVVVLTSVNLDGSEALWRCRPS